MVDSCRASLSRADIPASVRFRDERKAAVDPKRAFADAILNVHFVVQADISIGTSVHSKQIVASRKWEYHELSVKRSDAGWNNSSTVKRFSAGPCSCEYSNKAFSVLRLASMP